MENNPYTQSTSQQQEAKRTPNSEKVGAPFGPELNSLVQKAGGSSKKKKNISQINLKLPITTWIQGATRIMRSQELSEAGFTNTILGGKLELYSSLNLPFAAAS